MKKLMYIVVGFLLIGTSTFAKTTSAKHASYYANGYGNSFIFVEQGVEFAVFPDGQFDFNVDRYGPNFSAYSNFNGVSISFNTGHSYDAYVQYDDFGAVIQIENVPVYYDYYGRIIQAGNVHIRYNNRGYVSRVGGLYVHYNRYHRFSHYTGFINVYNRRYVYRPWHAYYVIPRVNFCVVFNRPYRQYYNPIRYSYYRPYRNNHRPNVSYNYGRRGNKANAITSRRSERYRPSGNNRNSVTQNSTPRRDAATTPRRANSNVRANTRNTREGNTVTTPRTPRATSPRVSNNNTPRPRTRATQSQPKPRVKTNTRVVNSPKPRTTTKKREVKRKNNRKTTSIRQKSMQSKPKASRSSSRKTKRSRI